MNLRQRLTLMKFNLSELSGGLGDLGTFIPLVVSLVVVCKMDGAAILFFAGLFNLLTGLLFNQPIPVQPMKAIAAVAIAEGLAPAEIAGAGLATGMVILILSLTGLVTWFEKIVPRAVVRGIQLGIGLKLAMKGITFIVETSWFDYDGKIVAIFFALLILLSSRYSKFPSALVVFIGGLLLLLLNRPETLSGLSFGWSGPELILPSLEQWQTGFFKGALPQVPLTLLNSVIAICALSSDYFPGKGIKIRPMATSVGLMNLAGCFFGSMPVCHGSGGLAGQYRFGARTGGSIVMLGLIKMLIATTLGSAAIVILVQYPASILGVLLLFSGIELTLPAREIKNKDSFFIVIVTALGILSVNSAVGLLFGLISSLVTLSRRGPQGRNC